MAKKHIRVLSYKRMFWSNRCFILKIAIFAHSIFVSNDIALMGAYTDVYNACIDIILHQWLRIPDYLKKRSIAMHIKVRVIQTTSSCQDFSHKTWF